ncbi:MAG: N-acetylglucosamine-6-phosphate deacetylase [Ginsengibacter sp.]
MKKEASLKSDHLKNLENGENFNKIKCIDCITGAYKELDMRKARTDHAIISQREVKNLPFVGPGLIDLQVNGINGIDFNIPSLTSQDLVSAAYYLLSKGVTTFFPTIVTNSDRNILKMVHTIHEACEAHSMLQACVGGIHLEGPFISPVIGAKGAHDEKYIKAPDWELFNRFQRAAGGRIKLVTLSPEWEGAFEFIEKCRKDGIMVAIGHSIANSEQISQAVKAGARLSTHLGNGVPLMLPRHPNIIWDQLAADELYACIIGDGLHVPDSFTNVVMKIKGDHTILVSDATCFAGMLPGEYENHIGGTIILDEKKRVSLKSTPGLLAGAGKSLLENIEYFLNSKLSVLGEAWKLASVNVIKMLKQNIGEDSLNTKDDLVMFHINGDKIEVVRAIKNGLIVFKQ